MHIVQNGEIFNIGRLAPTEYYFFSDQPEAVRIIFVVNNKVDEHVYADLWLVTQSQQFFIANSTFIWLGVMVECQR